MGRSKPKRKGAKIRENGTHSDVPVVASSPQVALGSTTTKDHPGVDVRSIAAKLLMNAGHHVERCEYDEAKALAVEAVNMLEVEAGEDKHALGQAMEILGTVELELGELSEARQHFLTSIELSTGSADPSPESHLYLAQLSPPEESITHFSNALTIFQTNLESIERKKLGIDGSAGSGSDLEEEIEVRRSASRALVGMTELYLTDLCFDPDAEKNCEKFLKLAAEIDPSDPEVYQTLASVRLSQERTADARDAAMRGWSLWKNLGPESIQYPPASARTSLAKIMIEMEMYTSALEILQRLENEDDEDGDMWYLSGLAWWMLGESRPIVNPEGDEEETKGECWSESKLCLQNYLLLTEQNTNEANTDQLLHVHELMEKLDAANVVASTGKEEEGDAEWEDESDDGDVEMGLEQS